MTTEHKPLVTLNAADWAGLVCNSVNVCFSRVCSRYSLLISAGLKHGVTSWFTGDERFCRVFIKMKLRGWACAKLQNSNVFVCVQEYLCILAPSAEVKFITAKDASGRGAALVAATSCRLKSQTSSPTMGRKVSPGVPPPSKKIESPTKKNSASNSTSGFGVSSATAPSVKITAAQN